MHNIIYCMHNILCFANNIYSQLIISSTWDMMCTWRNVTYTMYNIVNRAGTIYPKYRYSVYISILNIDKNNSNHTYLIFNFMQLKFSFEPIGIHIFLKVSSRLAVMYLWFEGLKIEQVPVMTAFILFESHWILM